MCPNSKQTNRYSVLEFSGNIPIKKCRGKYLDLRKRKKQEEGGKCIICTYHLMLSELLIQEGVA
jgi:hypothetical protein